LPPTVAVLGAGYAGLAAYAELRHRLRPDEAEVVVVNKDPYHTFVTQIHTIAGDAEEVSHVRVPLHQAVTPPAHLVVAPVEVLEAGPRGVAVTLRGAGTLRCAAVVLAVGYEPEFFGLPGLRENSHTLSDLPSARRLRERLRALAAARGEARVIVAGGGLTGVELAAEIGDSYPGRFRLTLVEGGPEIMPGFEPALVQTARAALRDKGVGIHTGARIAAARPGRLLLADGEALPFDVLIWAGGIRGNPLVARSGLPCTPRGQAVADPSLRSPASPAVFLAGDCSAAVDAKTGRPVPNTAQAAIQEGRHAAANLVRQLRGEPLRPFSPHLRGILISLGRHEGVGKVGPATVYGGPALALKHAVEAHHAYEVGGLRELVARLLPGPREAPPAGQPLGADTRQGRLGRPLAGDRAR
jgi:NADH dehydrogenase